MILGNRKQINPPDSDLEASSILELLINADSCLKKAARSAMEAKAFTLSAEISNMRCQLVKQIYSLMHNRREIVQLMTPAAQELFRQFVDRSARRRNDVQN